MGQGGDDVRWAEQGVDVVPVPGIELLSLQVAAARGELPDLVDPLLSQHFEEPREPVFAARGHDLGDHLAAQGRDLEGLSRGLELRADGFAGELGVDGAPAITGDGAEPQIDDVFGGDRLVGDQGRAGLLEDLLGALHRPFEAGGGLEEGVVVEVTDAHPGEVDGLWVCGGQRRDPRIDARLRAWVQRRPQQHDVAGLAGQRADLRADQLLTHDGAPRAAVGPAVQGRLEAHQAAKMGGHPDRAADVGA